MENKLTEFRERIVAKDYKGLENNNPLTATKFSADPAVLIYDDTVYIYATNDTQQMEHVMDSDDNHYTEINTLNVYSSKDLVNWTDNGTVQVGGWAKNSWAPAICVKKIDGKDKFFLYFADSARGIGVLTADNPLGPFKDPIGKALLDRSCPNMEGVWWLFDPAVLNDTDGKSYLYFGGGVNGDSAHPKSARCIELGADMTSVVGVATEIDAPWLFEDSGINKFGDTYYYTYCANWDARPEGDDTIPPIASIAYMTSKKPLGPFTYQGITLINPSVGNDHHWIFEFKGKKYIAYHTQHIEEEIGFAKNGYRNLYINDFTVNPDGSLPVQKTDLAGVTQVVPFNPYGKIKASTMHNCQNILIQDDLSIRAVTNKTGFVCIKGVDFTKGIKSVELNLAHPATTGSISIHLDSLESAPICTIAATGVSTISQSLTLSETKSHNLFITLEGDVNLKDYKFN